MSALDVALATGAPETDAQAEGIGRRIRRLRHGRGLTLVQLADLADLSHPFLSQLERGLARPSISSLEKIARALGSSQVELLAGAEPASDAPAAPVAVVRADEGTRGHYAEGEARMLVQGAARRFHPMEVTGANTAHGDAFLHAEDEFLHVVDGRIEIDLGVEGRHELGPGDSIYYAGGTPHRWRAVDGGAYRLLVVKESPTRR
jgi:transcriptional regulator with XRE-family HTH domain